MKRVIKAYKGYRRVMRLVVDVISIVVLLIITSFLITSILNYINSPDQNIISFALFLKSSINQTALYFMGPFLLIMVLDRAFLALNDLKNFIKKKFR